MRTTEDRERGLLQQAIDKLEETYKRICIEFNRNYIPKEE